MGFKQRTSCKALSPLFPYLIHLHGYQLEYHSRYQYFEHPNPHLISRSIRDPILQSLGWEAFAHGKSHNIFPQH